MGGSLYKRQGDPEVIAAILDAILLDRPDLRLHGFGCKRTSLLEPAVRSRLATADTMAWSYAARFEGRDQMPGTRPGASPSGSVAAPKRSNSWARAPGGGGRSSEMG